MNSRDMQRLIAMDAKIAELEYLYTREREKEKQEGKTTFLVSRAFKNRILVMNRARNKLAQAIFNKPGKNATYAMELARRRENYENALADKKRLANEITQAGVALAVNKSEENITRLQDLLNEMKAQVARVTAKQRAFTNWSAKTSTSVDKKFLRDKLPKIYDAEEDAKAFYGTAPMDEEVVGCVKEYKLKPEEPEKGISKLEKESNLLSTAIISPPSDKELASSSNSEERIAIELEEKPQLDSPSFELQKKRVVIE